jgi:NAD-dependent aldehyde dehydrogenases
MELKNKSLFKQQCFIGGKWVKSQSGETIEVDNPASQETIGVVPKCGAEETKQAIDSANLAFKSWKSKTAKERSIILKKWHDLILENIDDLAHIMTVEQGKPLAEAKGEITMGTTYIEFYAEECKRVYGDIIPDPLPDRRIVVIKQPVGVVGAITPWNFPSTMITRKCAPALGVGCPVI